MDFSFKRLVLKCNFKRRIVITLGLISVIIYILHWSTLNTELHLPLENCFATYDLQENEIYRIEDILLSKKQPEFGKSIFFHDTTCRRTPKIELTSRQACAIESAARANPNSDIFVTFTSSTYLPDASNSSVVDALRLYSNVHFRTVNLWSYAADTPAYDWLAFGKLFESKHIVVHLSEFLRYLNLWKWGGTYLDLDVIVLESLEHLQPNYAGAVEWTVVGAGVMNFDHNGFGHEIIDECLRNFLINFNDELLGDSGSGVITRALREICRTNDIRLMTRERCFGFKVLPIETFYPVNAECWQRFLVKELANDIVNKVNKSILIHFWDNYSFEVPVKIHSTVAYDILARKFCPNVYKFSGEYF